MQRKGSGGAWLLAALLAASTGCLKSESDPELSSDPVPVPDNPKDDPCAKAPAPGEPYRLCIWVRDTELATLYASPKARLEVSASASLAGVHYSGGEFELHGGAARTWPKKSYRFQFPDSDEKFDFFGDGAETQERIVLQAAWIDETFIRAKMACDLVRELGGLAPRFGFARLYINGKAQGLYQVIERIDDEYLESQGLNPDANLLKAESHSASWAVHANPVDGFDIKTDMGDAREDADALFHLVAATPATHEEFESKLEPVISFEDFLVWYWVMDYALNADSFDKNYYLYHDSSAAPGTDEALVRIVQWDADTSFGKWWTGTRIKDPADAELVNPKNVFADKMLSIPEYRRDYLERFADLLENEFSPDAMKARAEPLLDELEPDIRADLKQWDRENDFDDEKEYLMEVLQIRYDVMRAAVAADLASLDADEGGNR